MRSIFLLGGFVGFAVIAASEMQAGYSGNRILLDGAIACLVGGFLFRWFWTQIVAAFGVAIKAKRVARKAAEEAEAAAAKAATPVIAVKGK
jgi:hypothetical protein